MIKTLRITSVVAVILAILFFAFPIIYGVRNDENVEKFLNSPTVIEKFQAASGDRTQTTTNQEHPLVQQAKAFALIINPPKQQVEVRKTTKNTGSRARAGELDNSPKFKVKATSYYAQNPELSLALIDEPGKGTHWISKSDTVQHLIIDEIRDGVVIVRNDKETFKVEINQKKTPPPAGTRTPAGSRSSGSTRANTSTRPSPTDRTIRTILTQSEIDKTSVSGRTPVTNPEIEQLFEKIKQIDLETRSTNPSTPPISAEERAARIDKIVTEFMSNKNININDEEAKRLTELGKMLEEMRQ